MWLPSDEGDISDRENCVTLFNEVRVVRTFAALRLRRARLQFYV